MADSLRSVGEHVALARALVSPLGAETVELSRAAGRTLAADVRAVADSPPFTNSAMDGYAVRAGEVDPGGSLPVVGDIAAGSGAPAPLTAGTAVRIMTGAPLPEGADAVVPVERTDGGTAVVTFSAGAEPGAHVRLRGEDARAGSIVIPAGALLDPWKISAAASAGAHTLSVAVRPRVAVLATGDELVSPGEPLGPGQIYDSNSALMAAMLTQLGAEVTVLTRVGDAPGDVAKALESVDADLIVTAGGASVGAFDPVKADLAPRGVEFAPVAMQPGKPQGLGRLDGTPVACLPGNPVSVAVSIAVVVAPMVRAMLGRAEPAVRTAIAGRAWTCPPARAQYVPAVWDGTGRIVPATTGGSRSHLVASLAAASVLAVVNPTVTAVSEGDTVGVMEPYA